MVTNKRSQLNDFIRQIMKIQQNDIVTFQGIKPLLVCSELVHNTGHAQHRLASNWWPVPGQARILNESNLLLTIHTTKI